MSATLETVAVVPILCRAYNYDFILTLAGSLAIPYVFLHVVVLIYDYFEHISLLR